MTRPTETVCCKVCGEPYERQVMKRRKEPGRCRICMYRKGKDHHRYNGGLSCSKTTGRWQITCRDGSHVYYYRAVVEAHLGRALRRDEDVHHLNGDQSDDRLENLVLMTKKEHMRLHMMGRHLRATYERMQVAEDRWQLAQLWHETYGEEYPGVALWKKQAEYETKAS